MNNWYIVTPKGEQKAIPEAELKSLLKQGFLTGSSQVWEEGTPSWVPVSSTRLWDGPPPLITPPPPPTGPVSPMPLVHAQQVSYAKPLGGFASFLLSLVFAFVVAFLDLAMDADNGLMKFFVFGSSIWMAVDAAVIKATSFEKGHMWGTTFFTHHPFGLFIAGLLLWIIAFPYYLCLRSRIKLGLIPQKAMK